MIVSDVVSGAATTVRAQPGRLADLVPLLIAGLHVGNRRFNKIEGHRADKVLKRSAWNPAYCSLMPHKRGSL